VSNRFQRGSLLKEPRKGTSDVWVLRYYEENDGKRKYRRQIIGTVSELPSKRDAEKAVATLRVNINAEVRIPQTVLELLAHYREHELTRKAYASQENHLVLTKRYLEPRWGSHTLSSVRTVDIEAWLDGLKLAPASKTKIKSAFSVLYSHAIRHQWLTFNPISKVRTSSKRLREKDVLSPQEFQDLVAQLSIRDRAMVMLAGSTGLRRSEMIALTWADVNKTTMEVNVLRSCVRNRFGETKTECSRRPVPLHQVVLNALLEWREESPYKEPTDFLFPSVRLNGTKPLSPDSLLKRSIRPALKRAGIVGKQIGWHNFRHSLATNLRAIGVDVKVAQELLRHANSRTTLDLYTRAVSEQKRDANAQVVQMMLPAGKKRRRPPSTPVQPINARKAAG
jgi:site-specific recombinase XerD